MKVVTMKASKFVLDYNLYPRHGINTFHVSILKEALMSGHVLPPIKLDQKSKRVVDGFHRVRANQSLNGPDVKMEAILESYENDQAMFLDAVRLNATHGQRLSPYDQARCVAQGEQFGLSLDQITLALHLTPAKIESLKTDKTATYHLTPMAIKATMQHLAGEELTEEQVSFNTKAGGMRQAFYVNQIIGLLESGSIDWGDEKLLEALRRLHSLLETNIIAHV